MLSLTLKPTPLVNGPPEERATFGTLAPTANGRPLTEGVADGNEALLPGPQVAGYYMAEWLAWNWWRLLWEAGGDNPGREWAFAHCLSSIGEGYVWPNIEISSDGVYARVASTPTVDSAPGLFRYVGAPRSEVVSVRELEAAIGHFVQVVLGQLGATRNNLHRVWLDLEAARQDDDATRLRRLEARLGCDPDEGNAMHLRAAMDSTGDLGCDAVDELAADGGALGHRTVPSSKELIEIAKASGSAARPEDGATLAEGQMRPTFGDVAAWRCGVGAAKALRQQEGLDGQPIANELLSALTGTRPSALEAATEPSAMAFMLTTGGCSRVALRSKWETGRRFDLARLLGDRLLSQEEPLLPATRAYTYRQKAQRAFAQGLICPYQALDDFLSGDRSEERIEEAARHFIASPLMIHTVLANNEPDRYPRVGGTPPW